MNGRKRHILVDTLGLVLAQRVGAADEQDRGGAEQLLNDDVMGKLPWLKRVWADSAYRGKLATYLLDNYKCVLDIVTRNQTVEPSSPDEPRPPTHRGFQLVRWRWIVERTFAWLGRYRRISKDYEQNTSSSEAWMSLGMGRLMLGRLTAEP